MAMAALMLWIATAAAGVTLLGAWLRSDQVRREVTAPGRHRRLPPQLVFTHLVVAVTGLGVWVAFLVVKAGDLAWVTVALLALVVVVGATMFARWVPSYRASRRTPAYWAAREPRGGPGAAHRVPGRGSQTLPVAVVVGHGVLAVTTVALVVYVAVTTAAG